MLTQYNSFFIQLHHNQSAVAVIGEEAFRLSHGHSAKKWPILNNVFFCTEYTLNSDHTAEVPWNNLTVRCDPLPCFTTQ